MPKISALNAGVDATPVGTDIVPIVQSGITKRTTLSSVADNVLPTGAALTKGDDTNVTLTLGGAATTGLLRATSITVGWTGTLAAARLNSNVVQSVANDTNVTGSIAAQAMTLGWTGELAVARGGTGASTAAGARTNLGLGLSVYVNALDYGAVGDDSTDNATAFSDAYAAVVANGGGVLFIPAGTYQASAFPELSDSSVIVQGEGPATGGTTLRDTNTTADFLVISSQANGVRDIFFHPAVRKTAGYQISFDGAFHSHVSNCKIQYAFNGISVTDSAQCVIEGVNLRQIIGTRGVLFTGTVSGGSFGLTISDTFGDNFYPTLTYGTVKTWATSTAFTANDIISVNGSIYQCTTSGTSSGAGSGPSGLPSGTTPASAFTATITDGTALWKFVCSSSLTWCVFDNYAYSLRLNNVAWLNGAGGFLMTDTAATGTSYPTWVHSNNMECDHNYSNAVNLSRGAGYFGTNDWFGSSLTGSGFIVNTNHEGQVSITSARIVGNWQYGILNQAGPVDVLVKSCHICSNSASGSGSFYGVAVGANATKFAYQGNKLGTDPGIGSNNQDYGIVVLAGSSDEYIIADNLVSGNVTGGVSDNGSGSNKRVADNY